jgi:hypothetical protein
MRMVQPVGHRARIVARPKELGGRVVAQVVEAIRPTLGCLQLSSFFLCDRQCRFLHAPAKAAECERQRARQHGTRSVELGREDVRALNSSGFVEFGCFLDALVSAATVLIVAISGDLDAAALSMRALTRSRWGHGEPLLRDLGRTRQAGLISDHPAPPLGLMEPGRDDAVMVHARGRGRTALEQAPVERVESTGRDLFEWELPEGRPNGGLDFLAMAVDRGGRPFFGDEPFIEQRPESASAPAVLGPLRLR